nr:TonB-dependent receptor [Sphingomonas colocasiae]
MAWSCPAVAQETAAAGDDAVAEEIVVTAQRRSERLQDVPIAISALGGDAMADRGIIDIGDLRSAVPSLAISTFGGVNASNLVSIRGITGQPLPIGSGQAVAIYLDGVYLARPDAGFFGLDNIDRIEVLRGPQGTLYGRNATAGAINIITRMPGDRLEGGFDVAAGNYRTVRARGSVSGPIGAGLSAGFSASYDRHRGWFTNTIDGRPLGANRSYTLRGQLRYEAPEGGFNATISGDLSKTDGTPLFKGLVSPAGAILGIGDPDRVTTDIAGKIGTHVKSRGLSLTANVPLGDAIELTSISAYRRVDTDTSIDGDSSAAPLFWTASINASKSFNQELRAVFTGASVRATMGGNYFHEKSSFGLSVLGSAAPAPIYANPSDTSSLDAFALFGQFEVDLARALTLVGGLRYNHEQRDFTIDYTGAPTPGRFTAGNLRDSALLPSAGINFKASRDILLYAKVSNGYQAPGFNFAPGVAAPANTFKAEKLWAYEIGAKTQFLDRRVTLNVAGFYYDYKDIQVRSVTAPGVTVVNNAANATAKGIEGELSVKAAKGLSFGANLTWLDATYDSFCEPLSVATPLAGAPLCAPGLADRSGNRLSQAPKWSGGINAAFETDLSANVSLKANASYSFESGVFFTAVNEAVAGNGNGWKKLDGRVAIQLADGPEVYIFGRNLTDNRYIGNVARLAATVVIGSVSEPRTFGAGVRYRF